MSTYSLQQSLISVQDRLQLAIPNTLLMEQGSGTWFLQTKERFLPKRLHSETVTGMYSWHSCIFAARSPLVVIRMKILSSHGQDYQAGFVILAVIRHMNQFGAVVCG